MIEAVIWNKIDDNTLEVFLPSNFEETRHLFEEHFGECHAKNEKDFECIRLKSEYSTAPTLDFVQLEQVNAIAIALKEFEAEYGEYYTSTFLSVLSYQDLLLVEEVNFYSSEDDYLLYLYELYGLTDIKFLWGTIDKFLDDDYVFSRILTTDCIVQADNGVVVEWRNYGG